VSEADDVDARRASFLSVTDDYERTRPQYPEAAIRWAVGSPPKTVLDLGCGPGKLTAQLVALGHSAFGIDPSQRMLSGMRAKGLLSTCGRAEQIPIVDAALDVVTAAQAFHWFDHKLAVPEMRRVLKEGGRVCLFWNLRDESVEWVRRLSEIIGSEDAMGATLGDPDDFQIDVASLLTGGGAFESVEVQVFPYVQRLSEEGLIGLVRSRSYVAILSDDDRDQLLEDVRQLFKETAEGQEEITLPYRTVTFRAAVS
jgi:SAM-dependent methyltransferase